MIIDPNNNIRLNTNGNSSQRAQSSGATKAPEASSASPPQGSNDSVSLSGEAQVLQRLTDQINAAPDVDLDKVEAIKQAISEGRFEVNPEKIAERMLEQDSLLG